MRTLIASAIFLLINIVFGQEAWIIDDNYKVDPVNGAVLEKGDSQKLKIKNKIWDRDANKVSLFGAKNEIIAFQLIIEGAKMRDISKNIVDIEIDGIASKNIEVFLESYIKIKNKWHPELLIPIAIPTNKYVPEVAEQINQGIWIDIKIPREIEAKEHKGKIIVNTAVKKEINLVLNVLDFQIPDKRNFELDIIEYASPAQPWKLASPFDPKTYQIEKKYFKMAHEHRGRINIVAYPQSGKIRQGGYGPEITGSGSNIKVADWSQYDKRYGIYFDGSAFDDSMPITAQYLPFNTNWPTLIAKYEENRAEYEAAWEAIAKEFVRHFKENKWDKTALHVFFNQKAKYGKVKWSLDEPRKKIDYQMLAYYADLTHKAFKDSAPITVKFRSEIEHFECEHLEYKSANAREILSHIDVWYVSKDHITTPDGLAAIRKIKEEGKEAHAYYSGSLFNASLLEARAVAWEGFKIGLDGQYYWSWVDSYIKEGDPFGTADGEHNGDSIVFYPGKWLGVEEPLPSIRLKASRRGCFDYEYFVLAAKVDKARVDRIIDSMAKSKQASKNCEFNNDPQDWENAREELSQIITRSNRAKETTPNK